MRKLGVLVCFGIMMVVAVATVSAQDVGLGVGAGMTLPTRESGAQEWDAAFNWGFYVNIPLLATFHLSPSAELYKLDGAYATDIALAFKFMVPLNNLAVYAGFVPGLTASGTTTNAHVGVLGGLSFDLVSNLGAFAQLKYKNLFADERNVRVFHLNGGVLFTF